MRTKAQLTETTHANSNSAYRSYHRRASTWLTAAITGEPQLGLQKLRHRDKNAENPLKAGHAAGSGAPDFALSLPTAGDRKSVV